MKTINKYQMIATIYFSAMAIFWVGITVSGSKNGNINFLYSLLFGLIPLVGGIVGMNKSKIWGGLSTALGKAVFFISLGLLLWGAGESIWSYYNFVRHIAAPYPSIADIGFAPSILFWGLGVGFLSIAMGAWFAIKKSHWSKFILVGAPILLLVPSYYLQIKLARGGVLIPTNETLIKSILDVLYPFGDFVALAVAIVVYILSFKYFGGFYRSAISYVLSGLAVMYVGDSIFSYTTTKGTYYNANWGDLILTLGLFLITYGVLAFATKPPIQGAKSNG
jgi:hypothetical protein